MALLFAVELLNRALKQQTAETCSETVAEPDETETSVAEGETGVALANLNVVSDDLGRADVLTAQQRMWVYYAEQVAAGRSPSGAELDRVAGTHNYGRRVLRRWRRSGRLAEADAAAATA
ncbi:hypothetical protein [Amycolatopsis rubida]|uniref:hypothetical protein n=1 Tax=Amycolatopsis rubida TaxID=112413 RepID=UPI001AD819A3|nr:hypothetical protein [Amycolatopsis rubida]